MCACVFDTLLRNPALPNSSFYATLSMHPSYEESVIATGV